MKGLIVAGTHSGCGKTTIAMGFMAAFRKRGMKVAPFKVGPDFIDPDFHKNTCDHSSRNLDGWMLSKEYNKEVFYKNSYACDVAIVEGVMGLFDGHDGRSEAGSTAEMAKWLSLPVLLVVNARSMSRSAAAMVYGFKREVTLKASNLLGKPGEKIRGHEFHYSEIKEITEKIDPVVDHNRVNLVYQLSDRPGLKIREEGYMKKNVMGSYVHLHFGSNPQIAENFVLLLTAS